MFSIQVQGQALLLYPGTVVEHQFYSALYPTDGGITRDDITIPFEIPNDASGHNATLLGHPHLITNADRAIKDTPAALYIGGLLTLTGVVNVNIADAARYNITFSSGPGVLANSIGTMTLRSLMQLNNITSYVNTVEKQVWLIAPSGQNPLKIEVNNTSFEAADMSALASAITAGGVNVTAVYDPLRITYLELRPTTGATDVTTPFHVVIPSDTDYWQLAQAEMETWINAYWQGWQTYVDGINTAGTQDADGYAVTTVNQSFANLPGRSSGVVNNYVNSGIQPGFQLVVSTMRPINQNSLAYYYSIQYIFDLIEAEFDLTISGPLRDDVDLKNLLIYHPNTFDSYQPLIGNTDFLFWVDQPKSLTVPDIAVAAFMKALANTFRMVLQYDAAARTITFISSTDIYSSTEAIDLSAVASPLVGVNNTVPQGVELLQTRSAGDLLKEIPALDTEYAWSNITIGNSVSQIPIAINGLSQIDNFPTVDQLPSDSFDLRLMFYTGTQANVSGTYQSANINNGTNSLAIRGTTGIYLRHWQAYITHLLQAGTARTTLRLSAAQLATLDKLKKIRLPQGLFFLRELSVQAGADVIKPARALIERCRVSNVQPPATPPVLAWRGQESTAICLVDANGVNTGVKRYQYIEEYDTDTTIATGNVQINRGLNFVNDVTDTASCPIQAADLIYWQAFTTAGLQVQVSYNGTAGYSATNLPLPMPYNLPNTFATITASNSTTDRIRITASVVQGSTTIVSDTATLYSGVDQGDGGIADPNGNSQNVVTTATLNLSFTPTAGDYEFTITTQVI